MPIKPRAFVNKTLTLEVPSFPYRDDLRKLLPLAKEYLRGLRVSYLLTDDILRKKSWEDNKKSQEEELKKRLKNRYKLSDDLVYKVSNHRDRQTLLACLIDVDKAIQGNKVTSDVGAFTAGVLRRRLKI